MEMNNTGTKRKLFLFIVVFNILMGLAFISVLTGLCRTSSDQASLYLWL